MRLQWDQPWWQRRSTPERKDRFFVGTNKENSTEPEPRKAGKALGVAGRARSLSHMMLHASSGAYDGSFESPLHIVGLQLANKDATTAAERDANTQLGIDAIRAHAAAAFASSSSHLKQSAEVDLFLLGEMFTVGYSEAVLNSLDVVAEPLEGGPSVLAFAALAKELGTIICFGFPRRRRDDEAGKFSISVCAVGPTGPAGSVICCYDKVAREEWEKKCVV